MAHSLKLHVIAEGVETQDQLSFLESEKVDELQGYYLGMPMSMETCLLFLRKTGHYDMRRLSGRKVL